MILRRAEIVLLWMLPFLIAVTFRHILWVASSQQRIFYEFRAVVLFLPDIVLFALAVLFIAQIIMSPTYRQQFAVVIFSLKPQFLLWTLLCLWMVVSAFQSLAPQLALYSAIQLCLCLLLAVILANTRRLSRARTVVCALTIAAALQGIISFLQVVNDGSIGLESIGEIFVWPGAAAPYRGSGLAVHPNNLAGFLLVGLFSCLWLWHSKAQILALLLAIPIAIGLLATQSRGALLATMITFPLALVLINAARIRGISRPLKFAIGILSGITILIIVITLQGRLFANRPFHLNNSWQVIEQSPLTGSGANNLLLAIGTAHPDGEILLADSGSWLTRLFHSSIQPLLPVHNLFLMVWGELGIVGLGLFTAGIILAIIAPISRKYVYPAALPQARSLSLIWTACLVGLCIISVFDYYFWGDFRSRVLLFWVIGMSWSLRSTKIPLADSPTKGANIPHEPAAVSSLY